MNLFLVLMLLPLTIFAQIEREEEIYSYHEEKKEKDSVRKDEYSKFFTQLYITSAPQTLFRGQNGGKVKIELFHRVTGIIGYGRNKALDKIDYKDFLGIIKINGTMDGSGILPTEVVNDPYYDLDSRDFDFFSTTPTNSFYFGSDFSLSPFSYQENKSLIGFMYLSRSTRIKYLNYDYSPTVPLTYRNKTSGIYLYYGGLFQFKNFIVFEYQIHVGRYKLTQYNYQYDASLCYPQYETNTSHQFYNMVGINLQIGFYI